MTTVVPEGAMQAGQHSAQDNCFALPLRPPIASMKPVTMYTTQVCPFCIRAKALLRQRGVEAIQEIRVDADPAERDNMIRLTGRRTVPQIFIGGNHVGGCDDLVALDQRGALIPMLNGS